MNTIYQTHINLQSYELHFYVDFFFILKLQLTIKITKSVLFINFCSSCICGERYLEVLVKEKLHCCRPVSIDTILPCIKFFLLKKKLTIHFNLIYHTWLVSCRTILQQVLIQLISSKRNIFISQQTFIREPATRFDLLHVS